MDDCNVALLTEHVLLALQSCSHAPLSTDSTYLAGHSAVVPSGRDSMRLIIVTGQRDRLRNVTQDTTPIHTIASCRETGVAHLVSPLPVACQTRHFFFFREGMCVCDQTRSSDTLRTMSGRALSAMVLALPRHQEGVESDACHGEGNVRCERRRVVAERWSPARSGLLEYYSALRICQPRCTMGLVLTTFRLSTL